MHFCAMISAKISQMVHIPVLFELKVLKFAIMYLKNYFTYKCGVQIHKQ